MTKSGWRVRKRPGRSSSSRRAADRRLEQIAERRAAQPSAHREAAALLVDEHVAAEHGAVAQVVRAAAVVRELRERGMDGRTVIALREVLEEQLPVRADVVLDPAGGLSSRQPPGRESAEQRRQRPGRAARARRRGSGRGTPPIRRAPRSGADSRPCRTTATSAMWGAPSSAPSRPYVQAWYGHWIAAGEAAALRLAHARAAVPADVVERPRPPSRPRTKRRLSPAERRELEVAGLGERLGAADAEPAAGEDPLLLAGEDLLRRVELAGQRRRRLREGVALELHRRRA